MKHEAKECLNELGATASQIYLGDSVYAGIDGGGVWLITWNGFYDDPRNKIYLELPTYEMLAKYVENAKAIHKAHVEIEKDKS